ncbi:hypothetical protein H0H93_008262 [Arthromyces matolae]|nr:hypothetical protein H0H93_008262 [Arthromyces matolae]
MPVFRNLKTRRSSGRIWNKPAISYDEHGWEIPPRKDLAVNLIPCYRDLPSPHSSATSPSIASVDSEYEFYSYPPRKSKGKAKAAASSSATYIPRPKNAFILFRSHFYQTSGGSDQNQISVAAGKAWKALSDEEKLPFQLQADEEKRSHQEKFPDYSYAPGKGGLLRRKSLAAKKRKAQLTSKKSVTSPVSRRQIHSAPTSKVEPRSPISLSALVPPVVPSLPSPSPIITDVSEPIHEVTEATPTVRSDEIFDPNWSFETAFVPTSDIPPLELCPKSEKDENNGNYQQALKQSSSLRPPNFAINNEPFCQNSKPVTVGSYLDMLPTLYYNYHDEGIEQYLSSSTSYTATQSNTEFDAWSSGGYWDALGMTSYGGQSTYPTTVDHQGRLYTNDAYPTSLESSLLVPLTHGPTTTSTFVHPQQDAPYRVCGLFSWAQSGQEVTTDLVTQSGPSPNIEGLSKSDADDDDWPPLTEDTRESARKLFEESGPVYGLLEGDKARDAFLMFDLVPKDIWKIWEIADTRKRGALDKCDFTLALYLINGLKSGRFSSIPSTTPTSIFEQIRAAPTPSISATPSPKVPDIPDKPKKPIRPPPSPIVTQFATQPPEKTPSSSITATSTQKWDVSQSAKESADKHFSELDTLNVGYIEGDVIVSFLNGFDLAKEDLAFIWELADLNHDGRLTREEFTIALHLAEQRLNGNELPVVLPISLIPPSLRRPANPRLHRSASSPTAIKKPHPQVVTRSRIVTISESPPLPPKPQYPQWNIGRHSVAIPNGVQLSFLFLSAIFGSAGLQLAEAEARLSTNAIKFG